MKILVFHRGSLGDTLVAIPALWAIRERVGRAPITLLSDVQKDGRIVRGRDVLEGSGLTDDYVSYPAGSSAGVMARFLGAVRLLIHLRRERFDVLFYLIRSGRSDYARRRDRFFFRLAGVRPVLAGDCSALPPRSVSGGRLADRPCPFRRVI